MDEARAMQLADQIMSDAELRERFSQDPVGVFEASGIELNAEDRQMLRSAKGLQGEELSQRISKLW